MAVIQDSGERREFESGAVRDIAEGKGRCDLLPLDVISLLFNGDRITLELYEFLREGNGAKICSVIRRFSHIAFPEDDPIITAILETSIHYEDGCKKYGERNWEKGIPCHCFVDSAVRHYLKYLRGDSDERHDRAFLWNLLGLLWTIEHHPELNDLPYNTKE